MVHAKTIPITAKCRKVRVILEEIMGIEYYTWVYPHRDMSNSEDLVYYIDKIDKDGSIIEAVPAGEDREKALLKYQSIINQDKGKD